MLKHNYDKYTLDNVFELMNLKAIAVPREQFEKLKVKEVEKQIEPVEVQNTDSFELKDGPVEENPIVTDEAVVEQPIVLAPEESNIFDIPTNPTLENEKEVLEETPVIDEQSKEETAVAPLETEIANEVQEQPILEETPEITEEQVAPKIEKVTLSPIEKIQKSFEELGEGINDLILENQKYKSDLLKYLSALDKSSNELEEEMQRKKAA